jgi:hypothetical protein
MMNTARGFFFAQHEWGERMGGFPVHYLLVDAKGKTARVIVRERGGS